MAKSVAFTTTALSISQVENILRNPPDVTISTEQFSFNQELMRSHLLECLLRKTENVPVPRSEREAE